MLLLPLALLHVLLPSWLNQCIVAVTASLVAAGCLIHSEPYVFLSSGSLLLPQCDQVRILLLIAAVSCSDRCILAVMASAAAAGSR